MELLHTYPHLRLLTEILASKSGLHYASNEIFPSRLLLTLSRFLGRIFRFAFAIFIFILFDDFVFSLDSKLEHRRIASRFLFCGERYHHEQFS